MTLATLFHDVEKVLCRPSGLHLTETEDALIASVLVAGVPPAQVEVNYEQGSVSVEAKSDQYRYSYLIPLPTGQIDESATPEALCEHGILKITIPKQKAPKPLKIPVKVG